MDTIQHSLGNLVMPATVQRAGLLRKFMNWCDRQQENRIAWLAIALAGHGCMVTPITIFFIMMAGNSFIFWPLAMGAMAMCLVVNLAALPTRITIPVLVTSLLLDLIIIANCVFAGLAMV
ncbi:MAG: hypothetical protein ABWZ25_11830 [Chitinophagaceae bacterium]